MERSVVDGLQSTEIILGNIFCVLADAKEENQKMAIWIPISQLWALSLFLFYFRIIILNVLKCSWFSLFTLVTFYEISVDTESVNIELLLLGKIQG